VGEQEGTVCCFVALSSGQRGPGVLTAAGKTMHSHQSVWSSCCVAARCTSRAGFKQPLHGSMLSCCAAVSEPLCHAAGQGGQCCLSLLNYLVVAGVMTVPLPYRAGCFTTCSSLVQGFASDPRTVSWHEVSKPDSGNCLSLPSL
jgi:hypothetical protein